MVPRPHQLYYRPLHKNHSGQEVDDIEQWLNGDFETPATEALQNVLSDCEMTERDWYGNCASDIEVAPADRVGLSEIDQIS